MSARRALILVPSDRVGGAEKVLEKVTLEALEAGYSVEVLCLSEGTRGIFAPLTHPRLRVQILSRTRELFGVVRGFLYFLNGDESHYTFAFSSHVHCNAYLAALRHFGMLRTRALICRESTVIARRFKGARLLFYRICYLFYFKSVDWVICQTNDMRTVLLHFAPWLQSNRVLVIPNPAPSSRLEFPVSRSNKDGIRIVSVGRLIPEKGYSTLLRAFRLVTEKYPAAHLDIFGEGRLREELDRLRSDLRLTEGVQFRGVTSHPLAEMAGADLCVVSSTQEGFPNTLLEMMSVNQRVVSTLCADGVEKIAGLFTCPPDDPAALAAAINDAISAQLPNEHNPFEEELARRSPKVFFQTIERLALTTAEHSRSTLR